ncbi:MAG TPA: RNA polymerase sigma factor [Pyrinomonadaceae bacterium]|jgi:RNA polymerase sigma-70 factor (ECF subfamily)
MAEAGRAIEIQAQGAEISDDEAIGQVRRGEIARFEVLMRRYNQRLYRIARAIVGNDSEAEDVVQEAYFRAYTHLDQFAGRAKFSTWLTKIAVNEALHRLRRSKRFDEIDSDPEFDEGSLEVFVDSGRNPEQKTSDQELRTLLEAAVDSLPENYKSVFMLRQIEGLNTTETAECLSITEENVKGRLFRARALLRQKLGETIGTAVTQTFPFAGSRCDGMVAAVLARILAAERRSQ